MEEESKNEEILSKEEVDSLRNLLDEIDDGNEETLRAWNPSEIKTRKVKIWDFRRGNGFTRTETEAFKGAGKEIALAFANALCAYTKESAECRNSDIDFMPPSAFHFKELPPLYEFDMGGERAFVWTDEKMVGPFLFGKSAENISELPESAVCLACEKIASLLAKSAISSFGMEQTADGGIRQIQSVQEYEVRFSGKEEGAAFAFELEFSGLQFQLTLFVPRTPLVSLRDKICPRAQKAPEGVKNTLVCIGGFNMPSVPLEEGQIFELDTMCGEAARIVKDGKVIALAEVVAIEENFGIRITCVADSGGEAFLQSLYASLSQEEKGAIVAICKELIFLAERARREGILALEDYIDNEPLKIPGKNGRFMYLLLHCIIEGWEAKTVSRIADNYIASSCESDFERLCFSVIKDGVLAIQCGDSTRTMQERFVSLAGLENEKEFREQTGFAENWY